MFVYSIDDIKRNLQ